VTSPDDLARFSFRPLAHSDWDVEADRRVSTDYPDSKQDAPGRRPRQPGKMCLRLRSRWRISATGARRASAENSVTFEKPEAFTPGKVERSTSHAGHQHTSAGHRIMVQVQSSWFPLTDRKPQTFVNIPTASPRLRESHRAVYHTQPASGIVVGSSKRGKGGD